MSSGTTQVSPWTLREEDHKSEIEEYITSRPRTTKTILMIRKKGMRFQMIQEVRVEKGFRDLRQSTSESHRAIVGRIRAATFPRNRLDQCALPKLRESTSIET